MADPSAELPRDETSAAASDGPRLPSSVGANPSMVVPPARQDAGSDDDLLDDRGRGKFSPLRVDPPPRLAATWWLRISLFGLLFVAPWSVLWTEYAGAPGDVRSSLLVASLHIAAAVCLVVWSVLAIHNAAVLVPPTKYQSKPRPWLAALLWLLAFAAPVGVGLAHSRLAERLTDPDDRVAVAAFLPVVFVAFLLVWMPFRYCARQAGRIGAPHLTVIAWFWVTLIATVGGIAINGLGLDEMLAENGVTDADRVVRLGVLYGVPMFVFALSTWRATAVFDEVIDIRWRRWKSEWEQTLRDFVDQPEPGPEAPA